MTILESITYTQKMGQGCGKMTIDLIEQDGKCHIESNLYLNGSDKISSNNIIFSASKEFEDNKRKFEEIMEELKKLQEENKIEIIFQWSDWIEEHYQIETGY
jgi:hypothetical protein